MQIRERQASLDRASFDLNLLDSIWPKLFNLDPHIRHFQGSVPVSGSLEAASFLEIKVSASLCLVATHPATDARCEIAQRSLCMVRRVATLPRVQRMWK
jgi:hypothetical protein